MRLFIIVANTLLHYLYKGANKRAVGSRYPLAGLAAAGPPAAFGDTPTGPVLSASRPVGFFGAMGRASVTTMSSAGHTRRDFLYIATSAVGAVGAAAVAWPLISQMNPDASTIAAGAPIEVDLSPVAEGQDLSLIHISEPTRPY